MLSSLFTFLETTKERWRVLKKGRFSSFVVWLPTRLGIVYRIKLVFITIPYICRTARMSNFEWMCRNAVLACMYTIILTLESRCLIMKKHWHVEELAIHEWNTSGCTWSYITILSEGSFSIIFELVHCVYAMNRPPQPHLFGGGTSLPTHTPYNMIYFIFHLINSWRCWPRVKYTILVTIVIWCVLQRCA